MKFDVELLEHYSSEMLVLHPGQQSNSLLRNQVKRLLNCYQDYLSALKI